MKLIIAGGGTGGHLFPAIAIAEEFKSRSKENEVLFVGVRHGIESRLLPEKGWPVRFVAAEGIKGRGTMGKAKGVFKMLLGAVQSFGIIRAFRPGIILGVGGYVSAPVVLAGRLMGVRAAIHEQNAIPGITNRVLGRLVNKIFLTYDDSKKFFPAGKVEVTGNPVRRDILKSFGNAEKTDKKKFTVLVFGGSRGARKINEVSVDCFKNIDLPLNEGLRIIHQTGHDDYEEVCKRYEDIGIEVEVSPFIEDMASAYMAADLVVCRAGATTISELMAAGKPSLLIPYPFAADDHQRLNAESIVKKGAARLITEKELDPGKLAMEIEALHRDRETLKEMGIKAKKLSETDAAATICDRLTGMLN